jgi:hypothetical protein
MEFRATPRAEEGLARVELTGAYDADAFIENYAALMARDRAAEARCVLFDARKLAVGHVTSDEVKRIIDRLAALPEKRRSGKAAWVVGDALGYGMGRMFAHLADGKLPVDIRVFYDLAAAEDWLREEETPA